MRRCPQVRTCEVARALKAITGVVDHGLFLDFAPTVIVGGPSGARVFSGG